MADAQFPAEDDKQIAPWKVTSLNNTQETNRKEHSTTAMNRGILNFIWGGGGNTTYIISGERGSYSLCGKEAINCFFTTFI